MNTIKAEKRTKNFNVKLTPTEFKCLEKIRELTDKPISELLRQSIVFYCNEYRIK